MICCFARCPSLAIDSRSVVQPAWKIGVQAEPLCREDTGLDPTRQLDLLRGGEQRHPADLAQVDAHQVGGRAGADVVERRQLLVDDLVLQLGLGGLVDDDLDTGVGELARR